MFRATPVVRTTTLTPDAVAKSLKAHLDPWRPFGSWFGVRKYVGKVHPTSFSVTRQQPLWNAGVRLWLRGKIEQRENKTVVTARVGVHPTTKLVMFSVLGFLVAWFGVVLFQGLLGSSSLQLVVLMTTTIAIYFFAVYVFGPIADGGAKPLTDWLDASLASPNTDGMELQGNVDQNQLAVAGSSNLN